MNYAQTNLQLYRQLWSLGYSKGEIAAVQKAYEFGMEIFAGQFRPTNKPFLCHLIGTASILVSLRQPITVVTAGLLHAIYSHGDFGDGTRGLNVTKTKKVREIIGEASETLIAHYTGQVWDVPNLLIMQRKSYDKNPISYSILTIRLADVLEDTLDFGIESSRKPTTFGENGYEYEKMFHFAIEVANNLGNRRLATEFEHIRAKLLVEEHPPIQKGHRTRSFVLAPQSFTLKTKVKIARKIQRIQNFLINILPWKTQRAEKF